MPRDGYGDVGPSCFGKTRFEGHQGAQARKLAQNITRRSGQRADAYRCQWCGGWHVGRGARHPKALVCRGGQASVRPVSDWSLSDDLEYEPARSDHVP